MPVITDERKAVKSAVRKSSNIFKSRDSFFLSFSRFFSILMNFFDKKEFNLKSISFFCGFLVLLPLLSNGIELDLKWSINGPILLMVLISGLAGMWFYYMGLKRVTARVSALAEMFFPLAAVTINWVFLGKALEPIQIFGAILLIVASTMIQVLKL